MSQKRNKTVPQLVEKYRREFPALEKRFIRRLILAEHKELFNKSLNKNDDSEVRKLSRYLEKAFSNNTKNIEVPKITEQSAKRVEITPEMAKTLIYYRILEEHYKSKAAKTVADNLERYGIK